MEGGEGREGGRCDGGEGRREVQWREMEVQWREGGREGGEGGAMTIEE